MQKRKTHTTPSIQERLNKADWDHVIPRLVLFTSHHLSKKKWCMPSGKQDIDYAYDAITLVFEETRKIPENVKILTGLCNIIRSLVDHDCDKEKKKKTYTLDDKIEIEAPDLVVYRDTLAEKLPLILSNADDIEVAMIIMEGNDVKPRHIAEALRRDVKEIYKSYKRIRRRLLNWYNSSAE